MGVARRCGDKKQVCRGPDRLRSIVVNKICPAAPGAGMLGRYRDACCSTISKDWRRARPVVERAAAISIIVLLYSSSIDRQHPSSVPAPATQAGWLTVAMDHQAGKAVASASVQGLADTGQHSAQTIAERASTIGVSKPGSRIGEKRHILTSQVIRRDHCALSSVRASSKPVWCARLGSVPGRLKAIALQSNGAKASSIRRHWSGLCRGNGTGTKTRQP